MSPACPSRTLSVIAMSLRTDGSITAPSPFSCVADDVWFPVIEPSAPRLAVHADATIASTIERVAHERGHGTLRLFSGAGHDAQMLARVCKAGMVFVPSARGISHNPAEHTDDPDLEAGANVLLHVLLELAGAH